MRVVRWIIGVIGSAVLLVVLLDTFGGYLFDGPLGPIPGGAFVGPVDPNRDPQWDDLEKVIELEIRPDKPWSLSVWNVVIDGELYVPSARGAQRRWTSVALADPNVRIRTHGKIYEQRIEQVTDPSLRRKIGQAVVERYDLERGDESDLESTWFFHVVPRS
jgi:hypothetical protein